MIKIVLLALVLCGAVSAIQPGCRTRYELRMKWTVQDNTSRYWECSRWGKAVQRSCPIETRFAAPFQTCVPDRSWEPFPYYAPPTTVNDPLDECKEVTKECVDTCLDVPCVGGIVVDNKCECEGDWLVVDGVCRDPSTVCTGGWILVDGVCTDPNTVPICCVGGQIINGQCVCFGDATLVNGVCIPKDGQINDCGTNGTWDPVDNRCVCNPGSQLINGMCVGALGVCDGAPDSAYVPGELDCAAPACTEEQYWANTHFATSNPRTFWQCPGISWVQEMPCAPGTCFSFTHQVCVHARDWVNQCK